MADKKEQYSWKNDLTMANVTDVEDEKGNTKKLLFKGKDETEGIAITMAVSGPSDKILELMIKLRAVKAGVSGVTVKVTNPQMTLDQF